MKKLQSTKQSTKANTTISALQDAKNPSKQTQKNTSMATRQVKAAAAVTTNAKHIRFSHWLLFFSSPFSARQNYRIFSLIKSVKAGNNNNTCSMKNVSHGFRVSLEKYLIIKKCNFSLKRKLEISSNIMFIV